MAEKKEVIEKDPKRVVSPVGRVSFPMVFKAKAFEDQKAKFSCVLLFTKKTDLSKLIAAVDAAKADKWGSDKSKWPKSLRSPFRDGDEKQDLGGYEDTIYISASNQHRPEVVGRNLEPITEESDEFYAGCFARLALRAYAYDTKGNKGVSFSLESIQKTAEGERFSGRRKADEIFEQLDDEDAEGSDDDGGF